jgi:hypothetical protein
MAWETRRNGGYYYRKVRDGNRVRSEYVPAFCALLAESNALERRLQRVEVRGLIDNDRAEDRKATEACRQIRGRVRSLLLAAGFHEHKRQWRRSRMAKRLKAADSREAIKQAELIAEALASPDPSEPAKALVAEWLSETGGWREDGDLMNNALKGAVGEAAYSGYFYQESLKRGVEEMRAELGYEGSTLPERLLIEQVLLCWVRLGVLERSQTRAMKGSQPYAWMNYLETATTLAQRRYTNAIQSLARVRRLMRPRGPLFQVNVLAVSADKKPGAITVEAEEVRQLGEGR